METGRVCDLTYKEQRQYWNSMNIPCVYFAYLCITSAVAVVGDDVAVAAPVDAVPAAAVLVGPGSWCPQTC